MEKTKWTGSKEQGEALSEYVDLLHAIGCNDRLVLKKALDRIRQEKKGDYLAMTEQLELIRGLSSSGWNIAKPWRLPEQAKKNQEILSQCGIDYPKPSELIAVFF